MKKQNCRLDKDFILKISNCIFRNLQFSAILFKEFCNKLILNFKNNFKFFCRCGDRLLAVDGHSLESIPHHLAVAMLKQTSTRVVMEVVSWMGTEL